MLDGSHYCDQMMSLSTVEMRDEIVFNPLVIHTLESRVQGTVVIISHEGVMSPENVTDA